jgi:type VI protein secretion system component VasK
MSQYLRDYSFWHLALLPLLLFLWVYPLWRIIGRAGYPPAISLLAIFPAVGLILLWWLAFSRWPVERRNEPAAPPEPAVWERSAGDAQPRRRA